MTLSVSPRGGTEICNRAPASLASVPSQTQRPEPRGKMSMERPVTKQGRL